MRVESSVNLSTCRYRNIRFLSFLRRKSGIWQNIPAEALPGYLPFNQARQYARKLKIKRWVEWRDLGRAGMLPQFIPFIPDRVYKDKGWVNWEDWLDSGFLPFEKARAYMRKLQLKNTDEYKAWLKSGKRPQTIPHEPHNVYKYTGWSGLSDWLGTGTIANQKKIKLPYVQAKAYVQAIGIKTWLEYMNWSKSGERPTNIPAAPNKAYNEFENWGEFLGTGNIANQNKEYWCYEQAKTFLKPLSIRSFVHFKQLHSSGSIPLEIPKNPIAYYKKQKTWKGYPDFFSKKKSSEDSLSPS